ncbi:MAG: dTDP-4-dehydrorhamnose reductase [Gammaproteobacteria bacterium]|jgi:dTDP-4-dehydrorhamnose reductase|nr:dTDP-4-dehydrorhamnose reductase [Gammaproteobacteria bacterium]MCP4881942.1 dTDP-4-dehydrorhamnose reductase [Gammaproteobacteria bacterium]MDP6166694.1 dTDP-4-dehydrorhamnose reductase [Gammaproteobacteria bacterium]
MIPLAPYPNSLIQANALIKILVTGAKGQVGAAVCQRALKMGMSVVWFDAKHLDLSDLAQIHTLLAKHKPKFVINCASYSVVDLAEANPEDAYRVNQDGAANVASACADFDVPMLHLSTDYVFDGAQHLPLNEQVPANPVNIFGHSKSAAEELVRENCKQHIILRVGWIFSSSGNNFVLRTLRQIRRQEQIEAVDDQFGCPTYAADVARVFLAIVQQIDCGIDVWGTYHYSGAEVATWKGFAEAILAAVKQQPTTIANKVVAVSSEDWQAPAPRPAFTVLDCSKILGTFGIRQRPWRSGLVKVINSLTTDELMAANQGE